MAAGESSGGGLAFDTATLPAEDRFPTWASAMPFYEVRTPDPLAFRAEVRAWLLAPVIVVDARMSEVAFARTPERIRADGGDDIILQLLDGATFVADLEGRRVSARSGEIVLHDRAHALEGRLTEGRNVTVSMPRAYLEERLPAASVHGLVLRDGLARPLAAFLSALTDVLEDRDQDSAELARLLRDLLAAAVRRAAVTIDEQSGDATLALRARRYIRQNLSRALDVQSLCEALGVSRSRLYRAFPRDGGVARYVTTERLKRIHRLLSDPGERTPIGQLASGHGFNDGAHFSRLFRRTFGYTPQALRRRSVEISAAPRDAGDAGSAPAVFNRWEADRG